MERRQRAGHRRRPRARARANGHVRMRAASFESYRAWKAFGFGVDPAAVEPAAVEEPAAVDPADEGRPRSDGPSARSPDPRRHGPNRTRDVPRPHHRRRRPSRPPPARVSFYFNHRTGNTTDVMFCSQGPPRTERGGLRHVREVPRRERARGVPRVRHGEFLCILVWAISMN